MKLRAADAAMVLTEIIKEYKSVYDIKHLCGLAVEVEPLNKQKKVVQCHRCQLYGHIQKNCNAEFKCMKCGKDHSTHLCTKPHTVAPTCANCGGEHLSISLRCPKNPNNPLKQNDNANPWIKRKEEQNQTMKVENDLVATINKMMEDFQKQKARLLTKAAISKNQ